MTCRLALAALAATVLLLSAESAPAAERSRDLGPYERFSFRYTTQTPGAPTGFRYAVALRLPANNAQPPSVRRLDLTFAPGTAVDVGAVPACRATDAVLAEQGPRACPARSRIATGQAAVWIAGESLLRLDASVFATRGGVVVPLVTDNGDTLRVLRGTVRGRTLSVPVEPVPVGDGQEAALVRFSLRIASGPARTPVFRAPRRCPRGGWPVVYAPTFAQLGRVRLTDVSPCRPR